MSRKFHRLTFVHLSLVPEAESALDFVKLPQLDVAC